MDQLAGLPLLAWVPLLPLLGALINLTLGSRLSKRTVTTVAVGSVGLACALVIYLVFWRMFQAGESMNVENFVKFYTDDALYQFSNFPVAYGPQGIRDSSVAFLEKVASNAEGKFVLPSL